MIENPIKKFKSKADNFSCQINCNNEADIKKLYTLAQEYNCSRHSHYKDCFRHLYVVLIMFRKQEDKESFFDAVISSEEIEVSDKLTA